MAVWVMVVLRDQYTGDGGPDRGEAFDCLFVVFRNDANSARSEKAVAANLAP
jgi:hypothetical protein